VLWLARARLEAKFSLGATRARRRLRGEAPCFPLDEAHHCHIRYAFACFGKAFGEPSHSGRREAAPPEACAAPRSWRNQASPGRNARETYAPTCSSAPSKPRSNLVHGISRDTLRKGHCPTLLPHSRHFMHMAVYCRYQFINHTRRRSRACWWYRTLSLSLSLSLSRSPSLAALGVSSTTSLAFGEVYQLRTIHARKRRYSCAREQILSHEFTDRELLYLLRREQVSSCDTGRERRKRA